MPYRFSFWQEGGRREAKRNPPYFSNYYFLFFQEGCTSMFYSTQGSIQPQEIRRDRALEPDCAEAPRQLNKHSEINQIQCRWSKIKDCQLKILKKLFSLDKYNLNQFSIFEDRKSSRYISLHKFKLQTMVYLLKSITDFLCKVSTGPGCKPWSA